MSRMRTTIISVSLVLLLTARATAQEGNRIRLGLPEVLPAAERAPAFVPVLAHPRELAPTVVRGQAPEMPPPAPPPGAAPVTPPPPVPPPGAAALPPPPVGGGSEEPYNCGQVTKNLGTGGFFSRCWDKCKQWGNDLGGAFKAGPDRALFQSDHKYDFFVSPVSNPFYFEDPRALTEVRPVFIWEQTPRSVPIYNGGDNVFAGLQARVAFTDWLSLVVNKLGWTWSEPHLGTVVDGSEFAPHVGFSEVWLGPKITFWRGEKALAAAGLTFAIPAGSSKVFQNTGSLSLAPYVSYGLNFWPSSYGSFNFLTTAAYSIGFDDRRTDYFVGSFHLDYGILNRFYPLVELNWYQYTMTGGTRTLSFEGADLFNFGSKDVSGNGELSVAIGARIKLSDHIQTGFTTEWGLINKDRSLNEFRVTADMIFRY